MKAFIEWINKPLVDNPVKMKISQLDGEQSFIIEIKVAPVDVGKIIGKQGNHAQVCRVILGTSGMKLKKRFTLGLIEKE